MVKPTDIRQLIKQVRGLSGAKKENVTFRLAPEKIRAFKAACRKLDAKPAHVIEGLIDLFVKEV